MSNTELRLSGKGFGDDVLEAAPRIELSRRAIITGLACGTVVPFLSGCVTNPETGANQFLLVGEGQIAQMSASAWSDMKQQVPQTSNPSLRRRVDNVWNRISRGAGRGDEQWDVAVFDTEDVNAFVMPGNKVGVYRGMTDLVENDDQLSSVLGHEVGHVAGRHAAERYSQQLAGSLALAVGGAAVQASDSLRQYGSTIGALGGAALQFGVLLPYSRRHELEADRLGVDYMYKSGYRVAEAPRLWDVMAEKNPRTTPEFLSTHPDPLNRAAQLRQYINAKGYDLV